MVVGLHLGSSRDRAGAALASSPGNSLSQNFSVRPGRACGRGLWKLRVRAGAPALFSRWRERVEALGCNCGPVSAVASVAAS